MKPNDHSTPTSSKRSKKRVIAVAAVGALALTACTSDPGPRRVAIDIIEAESVENNPDLDVDCLTEAIKDFSDSELSAISNDLQASNTEQNAEGEAALDEFRQALASCN